MGYRQTYERWLKSETLDPELKRELEAIAGDEKEIEERFYKELSFGTAGLRGVIGVGTNRMNKVMVRKVTQGLAKFILGRGKTAKQKGVVIAYDSRHQSPEFAKEAGLVLARNGIKAYVFDELRPTPELSFAVRHLGAVAGIMITASHNPPEYNGYKVYGPDGAQIATDLADAVMREIQSIPDELNIEAAELDEAIAAGLYETIGEEVDDAYQAELRALMGQTTDNNRELKVVYTPLHGTGNKPVRRILKDMGFQHVYVVPEQEAPDPDFPTVSSPNPEERDTFDLAIRLAEQKGAELIMGTDPDTDRVGVAVRDRNGQFKVLSGNQLGALLLHYLLSQRAKNGKLPPNGVVIKTIVTSDLGEEIAKHYGVETINTLTGFKYIAEMIKQLETTKEKTFLFGYEESYGYLAGDFCRDKDAVQACMLIAEMAAYYHCRGLTLDQVLEKLFAQYGYHAEDLVSLTLKGIEGVRKIEAIMEQLRNRPPARLAGLEVKERKDYRLGLDGLPKANVLKILLADGSWFAARPSGTESKIKFYFAAKGKGRTEVQLKLEAIKREVMQIVQI
jgi:phosphoglucomutase